ncbi:unnamed protein product [marine sediment metagenome]|uniref:Uncharacterized protein n=1 Tax=marine sediment metagenome TaxID=412755 RepID=X0WTD1_9ZZZZ
MTKCRNCRKEIEGDTDYGWCDEECERKFWARAKDTRPIQGNPIVPNLYKNAKYPYRSATELVEYRKKNDTSKQTVKQDE